MQVKVSRFVFPKKKAAEAAFKHGILRSRGGVEATPKRLVSRGVQVAVGGGGCPGAPAPRSRSCLLAL